MNRSVLKFAGCLLMLFAPSFPVAAQTSDAMATTTLKVGDVAPDFSLPSDQNKVVKLSDYRGKKTVVLAFYVLAFTGG
jgi:cytochrome oxidase Cu insertion factor (SCO1/SenC/PrrC family)